MAFINTLEKFSSAIQYSKELAAEFWKNIEKQQKLEQKEHREQLRKFNEQQTRSEEKISESSTNKKDDANSFSDRDILSSVLIDSKKAVILGLDSVASLAATKGLTFADEDILVDQLMDGDAGTLSLAKTFARRGLHQKFAHHILRRFKKNKLCPACAENALEFNSIKNAASNMRGDTPTLNGASVKTAYSDVDVDVVVIGGGLAGLTATITLVDAGLTVALLEKQGLLGGNSAWASSGVNAASAQKNYQGGQRNQKNRQQCKSCCPIAFEKSRETTTDF